jgi:hypothetical protein
MAENKTNEISIEPAKSETTNKKGGGNDYYPPPKKVKCDESAEGTDNSGNTKNDKNYGRSKELYNKKLLSRQLKRHFVTIPQSGQDHLELYNNLKRASINIKYLCVAKEKHSKEGEHYHIYLTSNDKPIHISQLHRRIMETKGDIGGSINYQQAKNGKSVLEYIQKDGNFMEDGEIPNYASKHAGSKAELDKALNEIYNNEETTEENIQSFKENYPAYYTQYKEQIINELEAKDDQKLKKWKAPIYNTSNTTLKPYQQRIWDLINEPPTNRRIIWVHGKPNSGKSFMFNYIQQNYKYGIYSAGSTASLDNAVYGYDGQGAICWDIPLNYDFISMGDPLASTIEKFSDFGQYLTSRKYKGKKIQVLGHVLVFSNRSVLSQLKHRDIIRINTRDDETEAEKLSTWNITKVVKNNKTIWKEEQMYHGQESETKYYYSMDDLPIEIKEDVYNQ